MKKCKWAGDPADEYCKSCDGCKMVVDNVETECTNCAGYEASEEEIEINTEKQNNFMEIPQTEEDNPPFIEDKEKTYEKPAKSKKYSNNTNTAKEMKNDGKNKATNNKTDVVKVSEESNKTETVVTDDSDGIRVTSIRYTSGSTVKKGDNYFKFIAEEEWDVSRIEDVQEEREKLWAKLNAEVDSQIEELNNMN